MVGAEVNLHLPPWRAETLVQALGPGWSLQDEGGDTRPCQLGSDDFRSESQSTGRLSMAPLPSHGAWRYCSTGVMSGTGEAERKRINHRAEPDEEAERGNGEVEACGARKTECNGGRAPGASHGMGTVQLGPGQGRAGTDDRSLIPQPSD